MLNRMRPPKKHADYFEIVVSAFSSPQIKTKFHLPPQVTYTAKFLDEYYLIFCNYMKKHRRLPKKKKTPNKMSHIHF